MFLRAALYGPTKNVIFSRFPDLAKIVRIQSSYKLGSFNPEFVYIPIFR